MTKEITQMSLTIKSYSLRINVILLSS